jgi:uncharacterized glyoxalase superfamily protein PhnB
MPIKSLPRPDGFHAVTPYLIVDDARKLIAFTQAVFDATLCYVHELPDGRVMHSQIIIGDSILWLADSNPKWPSRSFMLYIYVEDVDAVYQRALDAGATSVQPPGNQFYGDRSCGVEVPGAGQWWIATHVENVSAEEVTRRQQQYAASKA